MPEVKQHDPKIQCDKCERWYLGSPAIELEHFWGPHSTLTPARVKRWL